MEKIAKKIADNIGVNLKFDNEKVAVMAYGLTAIFQLLIIFFIVSILGIIGNFWIEGMIIFILVGLLRKSTGGAHSSTFTGCLIFSIFFISLMSLLCRYLYNPNLIYLYLSFSIIVFAWSFYITYKKAPVASPRKPITNPKKIYKLRRNSLITLTLFFLTTIFLYYFTEDYNRHFGFGLSITMSVLWQTFMLTKKGHKFMNIIDRKLVDF
ncbi:MAG: hypothetical protein A2Y15_02960 [Clostridiales bacterium GWF2_36_10]|nr:MAG: hypothetical protein A2Y15_02960 [Clostridiales bacterium GWF2_36_10]HAN20935.1 hypothetical protein [Clostridiales bacterium]